MTKLPNALEDVVPETCKKICFCEYEQLEVMGRQFLSQMAGLAIFD